MANKHHIGVIPPHQDKPRRYLTDFKKTVESCSNLVPDAFFHHLSYQRLLEVSRSGAFYNVIIAARMKDEKDAAESNIFSAAREIRRLRFPTVFIISFNSFLARVTGIDLDDANEHIRRIAHYQQDPEKPGLPGMVRTTSTDPNFLVSIVADVMDNPSSYLDKKDLYDIENQGDFLNHPPGHTRLGMS
ncbi:MAG: hypothetical protein R6V10_07920 [bacterium]